MVGRDWFARGATVVASASVFVSQGYSMVHRTYSSVSVAGRQ